MGVPYLPRLRRRPTSTSGRATRPPPRHRQPGRCPPGRPSAQPGSTCRTEIQDVVMCMDTKDHAGQPFLSPWDGSDTQVLHVLLDLDLLVVRALVGRGVLLEGRRGTARLITRHGQAQSASVPPLYMVLSMLDHIPADRPWVAAARGPARCRRTHGSGGHKSCRCTLSTHSASWRLPCE